VETRPEDVSTARTAPTRSRSTEGPARIRAEPGSAFRADCVACRGGPGRPGDRARLALPAQRGARRKAPRRPARQRCRRAGGSAGPGADRGRGVRVARSAVPEDKASSEATRLVSQGDRCAGRVGPPTSTSSSGCASAGAVG
jgi:hypothetical protein